MRSRDPAAGKGKGPALWLGVLLLCPAILSALLAPVITPGDPFASVAPPFLSPSYAHPLGTDDLGRDLLVAVIHGARTSLITGGVVAALAVAIGMAVGCAAGLGRPSIDDALMRLTEFSLVVPRFFLAILIVALYGNNLSNLIAVLAVTSWGSLARVVRAEVLSLREREFVLAAQAIGSRPLRIAVRHIIPQTIPSVLPLGALIATGAILSEAGLSYLGLGDPNLMSWGYLLNNAQNFLFVAWWLSVFPGLAIVVTVAGLVLLLEHAE